MHTIPRLPALAVPRYAYSLSPLASLVGLTVFVAALCLFPAPGIAKLDVPYGEDGAPPDSETQAEVDALNEALEGPEDGQSWASWEREVQAAHEALFGVPMSSTTASEDIVASADLCRSPIDIWIATEATETVAEAIIEPSVRAELTQNLEEYLYGQLFLALWGTPVLIGQPTITGLTCTQCAMTYVECLTQLLGVDFCKRRYLTCPTLPLSALTIAVPLTAPVTGTVTFEASASYRELNAPDDPLPYEWCVTIHDYETDGFGLLEPVARTYINDMLAQGLFCAHAWNWDY